jgi:cytochrome c553
MKLLLSLMLVTTGAFYGATACAADAPKAKPDPAKGEQLFNNGDAGRNIVACASCHGPGGNSAGAANPKLAGQHPDYIYKQLTNFKVKEGAKTPERFSAIMGPQAAPLTDEDMRNIAAYLGAQKLKPALAHNKDTMVLGQQIFRSGIAGKSVPACAACHGPQGAGIPSQYPAIAGQFAEYTQAQLEAFRSGARKNSVPMADIAIKLTDAELKAVADYAAGLR